MQALIMEILAHPPKTLLEVYQLLPEGTLCQLICNQLIMSPSPSENHQKVLDKMYRLLGNFVEEEGLGVTRVAPYDVHFDMENVFQPDIIFISSANSNYIQQDGLHHAPDLVIEILSPSTGKYDQVDKKIIYERYGVKEYWLIDPFTKEVTGYQLLDDGFAQLESSAGRMYSQLLQKEFNF